MIARNPYAGRRPKPPAKSSGGGVSRQSTKQPSGHDVADKYLRGQAGGEAHPFYIPGGGKAAARPKGTSK